MLIMVQHQGQDIDHLTITTGLTQHLCLQQAEGLGHPRKGSTIAQGAGVALNDRQIMAPIVDDPPRLVVRPLNDTLMRANDMPLRHNNQTPGVNAQADRAVRIPFHEDTS